LFDKVRGLKAGKVTLSFTAICEAVQAALSTRYGAWEEPFRSELAMNGGDFTAMNEAVRLKALDALTAVGREDEALLVVDHSEMGPFPHSQIRQAVDAALVELRVQAGLTYAQRAQVPEAFQGFLTEVPPAELMMEAWGMSQASNPAAGNGGSSIPTYGSVGRVKEPEWLRELMANSPIVPATAADSWIDLDYGPNVLFETA